MKVPAVRVPLERAQVLYCLSLKKLNFITVCTKLEDVHIFVLAYQRLIARIWVLLSLLEEAKIRQHVDGIPDLIDLGRVHSLVVFVLKVNDIKLFLRKYDFIVFPYLKHILVIRAKALLITQVSGRPLIQIKLIVKTLPFVDAN